MARPVTVCGLLLKKPEKFLRAVAKDAGIKLAPLFAAGNVFVSRDATIGAASRADLPRRWSARV